MPWTAPGAVWLTADQELGSQLLTLLRAQDEDRIDA
jgi:hypothetical protein